MESAATAQRVNPFGGLYDFVKAHLLIINAVVLASSTLVGALDFLAPRLSVFPRVIYSATACLVVLMLISAFAPALVARLISAIGLAAVLPVAGQLWRRPAWQIALAILLGVTIVGFASVARASEGGVIASTFSSAKNLQNALFSMKVDVADIKSGVGQANQKLDKLSALVGPANVADRCADLECAVANGASPETIKRLFATGAQVPGNPINDGVLLLGAALASGTRRFEVLDLLAQKGIDRNLLLLPVTLDSFKLTNKGSLPPLRSKIRRTWMLIRLQRLLSCRPVAIPDWTRGT